MRNVGRYQLSNNERGEVANGGVGHAEAEGDKTPGPQLPVFQGREEVAQLQLGADSLACVSERPQAADLPLALVEECRRVRRLRQEGPKPVGISSVTTCDKEMTEDAGERRLTVRLDLW